MSTKAQRAANRSNSQKSTGPKTQAGKEVSSQNRKVHGLTGRFYLLPDEDPEEFRRLYQDFKDQHQPANEGEKQLVLKMTEHYWLSQRALYLQNKELFNGLTEEREKRFSLYLRYQTTNDRAFSRILNDLVKLQKERRKAAIGFESQKARQAAAEAQQARYAAAENRKNELHRYAVLSADLKFQLLGRKLNADEMVKKAFGAFTASQPSRARQQAASQKAA